MIDDELDVQRRRAELEAKDDWTMADAEFMLGAAANLLDIAFTLGVCPPSFGFAIDQQKLREAMRKTGYLCRLN